MLLTRTVAPADFLTDADVKAHLRIDHTYDDATVAAVKAAAITALDGRDGYLKRALCTQTWVWKLPAFPYGRALYFVLPPLQSVTSVQYYDTDDVLQTFDAASYRVHPDAHVGYLRLKPGAAWPATIERDDAVMLTFVAGYGTPANVPAAIKQAALLAAGRLYANRGDTDETVNPGDDAMTVAEMRLLAPYRLQEFATRNEEYWFETRSHPL